MKTIEKNAEFLKRSADNSEFLTERCVAEVLKEMELPVLMPEPSVRVENCQAASPRRLRPGRFFAGILLTTAGAGIFLAIAVATFGLQPGGGGPLLVLVAICAVIAIMLLGGGFGLMASASSGFDEQEFDRLMLAGNIAAVGSRKFTPES